MEKKIVTGLATGLFLIGMTSVASANLIDNGNFDEGLTDWDYTSNITLSTVGSVGDENHRAYFNVPGGDGIAQLYQNFDVDPLFSGVTVEFDFKLGGNDNVSDDFYRSLLRLEIVDGLGNNADDYVQMINKEYNNTTGFDHVTMDISFDGLLIDPSSPNARVSFALSENTGDYSWAILDDVNITGIPAPIPEPATMLLFGTGGLVGLVGSRIRKKKK